MRLDYLTHDQFVEDDSQRVEVDQLVVRLLHEHFRCKVTWSAAGVVGVVGSQESRDAEVCEI